MFKKPKLRLGRQPSNRNLPAKSSDGKYCILIVTSSRILRWPYRATENAPMYNTRKDAEKILKAYVTFANNNRDTHIKRMIEEFEIVEFNEETKELIS
jgi:hypothetical protein